MSAVCDERQMTADNEQRQLVTTQAGLIKLLKINNIERVMLIKLLIYNKYAISGEWS